MFSKLNRQGLLVASAFVVALIAAGCWYSLNTQTLNTETLVTSMSGAKGPEAIASANVKEGYGKLPLSFEPNKGQTDNKVKFLTRSSGYALFLTPNEAVLRFQNERPGKQVSIDPSVLRMRLEGANTNPQITGVTELPGKSNYFIGNDPRQWRTDIPTYAKVKYESDLSGRGPGLLRHPRPAVGV